MDMRNITSLRQGTITTAQQTYASPYQQRVTTFRTVQFNHRTRGIVLAYTLMLLLVIPFTLALPYGYYVIRRVPGARPARRPTKKQKTPLHVSEPHHPAAAAAAAAAAARPSLYKRGGPN